MGSQVSTPVQKRYALLEAVLPQITNERLTSYGVWSNFELYSPTPFRSYKFTTSVVQRSLSSLYPDSQEVHWVDGSRKNYTHVNISGSSWVSFNNEQYRLNRREALSRYKIVPNCSMNGDVLASAKLVKGLRFEVEGLAFHAVAIGETSVDFESDGLLEYTEDLVEKGSRTKTLAELEMALESNAVAMKSATEEGEVSEVGALYLERQTIERERLRIGSLPPLRKVASTHSARVTLHLGWNRVASAYVNVSRIH
jgi:hypothetical protein